jgi:hypothetical protein
LGVRHQAHDVHPWAGGAEMSRTRPRGIEPWSPRAATLELLDAVQAVQVPGGRE